ncbi:MAG TPA: bacterial transcriptional activator domain-containing protein [Candidatus Cybelea sp.]
MSGARAAVRNAVPEINPIVFTNDAYAWNPSLEVESDTNDFERCFNNGSLSALREGVEIYAGEFLAGDHSDWILPMRVRYEQNYVTMLESLARSALQSGDYGRATNFALRLVEVDRANERATQLAMLSAANAGHRATALAYFDSLERYLRKWLGVEPTAGTRQLRTQILKGEIPQDTVNKQA